jgi:hypothetical protein
MPDRNITPTKEIKKPNLYKSQYFNSPHPSLDGSMEKQKKTSTTGRKTKATLKKKSTTDKQALAATSINLNIN